MGAIPGGTRASTKNTNVTQLQARASTGQTILFSHVCAYGEQDGFQRPFMCDAFFLSQVL